MTLPVHGIKLKARMIGPIFTLKVHKNFIQNGVQHQRLRQSTFITTETINNEFNLRTVFILPFTSKAKEHKQTLIQVCYQEDANAENYKGEISRKVYSGHYLYYYFTVDQHIYNLNLPTNYTPCNPKHGPRTQSLKECQP